MKIVLAGGTGLLGQILERHFTNDGNQIVVLSRSTDSVQGNRVSWDAKSLGSWASEIDGADVVINLAGRSVNCRYTPANRDLIVKSRVESTLAIGQAIEKAKSPPKLWLQSGTATLYAHQYDRDNDEVNGIIQENNEQEPETWQFSLNVAKAWEAAFHSFDLPETRKVMMRISMIITPMVGSVFDVLIRLANRGLGGAAGDGQQYMSWMHDHDFVRAIDWIIAHPTLSGPINLAAPHPVPNHQCMKVLRQLAGVRFGLPSAKLMLEVGAYFMKTESELILKSRRVVSRVLAESGFEFLFPDWQSASREIYDRWKIQEHPLPS